MLTYDDCLGLSDLSPEEVAAIARHKHLPEIVALEMGWCLCGIPEGRQMIRRMVLDDIEGACRRGDTRTAGRLGLVLHHLLGAHPDRHGPAESGREADDARDASATPQDGCDRPAHAPRSDSVAPAWLRECVDVRMAAMLRHFGLDRGSAQARFPMQMQAAAMCCAACIEARRCRRFLAGAAGAEAPSAFCPNAPLFGELGQSPHPNREAGR